MPTFTDRATRTLKLQKAERPKIGYGLPPVMDGFEGENRIQIVNGNPRLYYRTQQGWYYTGLAKDGDDPDLPIASSTSLGLIKIGDGGTISSDGTYTATAATPAADDITGGDAAVTLSTSSGAVTIGPGGSDADVHIKGNDGGSTITALTFDISAAGAATFNNNVTIGALFIMPDVTNHKILVSDGTSYQEVAMSGDATIANTGAITLAAAQTNITSIYATDLIIGEDSQTAIDFGTANEIDFKINNSTELTLDASALYPVTDAGLDLGTSTLEFKDAFFDGTVTSDAFAGPLTGDVTGDVTGNADTATLATNFTVSANNTANETVYPVFVDGATGTQGAETDTGLTYNPSTGMLTITSLTLGTASTVRIYADSSAGGESASIGTAGQTIISYGSTGAPYWGNPISLGSGSEGRIQLSNGSTSAVTSSSSFGFGALDASPLVLTYAGNMNITGAFEVKNGSSSAGYINFYEDSDNGSNNVTLIGPASTADITLTLPSAAGTIIGTGNLSSITAVGTIASGTWEGTTVAVDQGGTGATSLNNLITMGTHTTGNYVATLTAGNLIDLQNNSGEGATPTIDVDLTEAAEDTIANGDYILFLDGGATGSHKKEALADLVGIMAGNNLTASGITLNFAATDFKEHDDVEPVSLGGTGATSLTSNAVLTGNGTSAITAESNLTFDGTHLTIATGSIQVRTIDYSDGDNAITIADGGGITVPQAATFSDNIYLAVGKLVNFGDTSGDDDRMLIRKNDDSDGEINVLSNNGLILRTDDTTRLTIASGGDATFAGDVYVSASGSPSFRVTDTTNTVTGKFQADNSVGKVGTHTNHSFELFSNNTTALTIDTSQNATFAGNIAVTKANAKITVTSGTNESASLRLVNDAQDWDLNTQTNDNFAIYSQTGSAAALTITPSTYNATFAGNIYGEADVYAYYSSDPVLKENKELIDNPLEKICKLGGYSFDWKESAKEYGNHLEGHDYGVMADEIQALFPELVQTRGNGIRAVKYDKLVPLLIEGIKELKQELNMIKGES